MPYYEKYEERYQTVYAAGGDLWGLSPDDAALRQLLETWITENALTGKTIVEFACGEGGAGKLLSDLGPAVLTQRYSGRIWSSSRSRAVTTALWTPRATICWSAIRTAAPIFGTSASV